MRKLQVKVAELNRVHVAQQSHNGGRDGNRDRDVPRGNRDDDTDLRHRLRNRDARTIILARTRDREEDERRRRREYDQVYGPPDQGYYNLDKYEGFPVFSDCIRATSWPDKLKLAHIERYDGKRDPEQWLRIYYSAIKALTNNSTT